MASKQALAATKEIIVATGSTPRSVPGIEVDRKQIIFSDEAIHLPSVPKSIAIMGSGAVGVEFASIFKSYGSEVTVIELLPRLVPGRRRSRVGRARAARSRSAASRCMTGTKVTSREGRRQGRRHRGAGRRRQVAEAQLRSAARGDRAAARSPKGLGAEDARPQDGSRLHCRRSAVRDQRAWHLRDWRRHHDGRAALSARARVVDGRHRRSRSASPGQDVQPINYDHVPRCTYTEPEIGSVGLTEAQAKERGP